jgi:hypothetical protein
MTIQDTKEWFNRAVKQPTIDNQRTQLGVHLEEVLEMLDAFHIEGHPSALDELKRTLGSVATTLKTDKTIRVVIRDRQEFLDGLTDQVVTATGCGHMFGMDVPGALEEVNLSNFSKFVDGQPIFNENGKIAKGPAYFKPNLNPFVGVDPVQS